MRIEDEYKKIGCFWLPGREENKIPGVLTINDGGKIELEVVGLFKEGLEGIGGFTRITGVVDGDTSVTLDNCLYKNFGIIGKSKILVGRALSGAVWKENEETEFNTFSFDVDCLEVWIGVRGIAVDWDGDNHPARINLKPAEKFNFKLDNDMELEICTECLLGVTRSPLETRLTQRARLKLSSKKLRNLSEFIKTASELTDFMCFAMDATVAIKNVSATSPEIQYEIAGKKHPLPISVYYESFSYTEKVPDKDRHEMLFDFDRIKDRAQDIFNSWINAYENLSSAFGLCFSAKAGAQKYLDEKFLVLARGLEAYYRISKTDDKASLKELLKKLIEPFEEHFGSAEDRETLLREIVQKRNYLTHHSTRLTKHDVGGKELWMLCLKMEAIFDLNFMQRIDFTDNDINSAAENSYALKRKLHPESEYSITKEQGA